MAPARTEEEGFDVSIKEVPVTEERRPFILKQGDHRLKDPGTARANVAASVEEPNGTEKGDWARKNKGQTVLQQHLSYFDSDCDGIIWPLDTYRGFYNLGYGIATWILLWPEDGRMKKDDIRRIYDGSLFFEIAERRRKQAAPKETNGQTNGH
ncbi:caleosin domain containing protein [Diplocarpon rosae]|nr:caleosin domain containing protein [Diplocarpon rosae]